MYKYTLDSVRELSPTCFELNMSPQNPSDRTLFDAGQYLAISTFSGNKRSTYRCFSIASAPNNRDGSITIGVRVGAGYTKMLKELSDGTEISVEGPFGEFTPDLGLSEPLVLIAGGIGVTPMMSIISEAMESGSKRPITLLYFNRSISDVPYLYEIKQFARTGSIEVVVLLDEAVSTDSAIIRSGKLDSNLIKKIVKRGDNRDGEYYICGPGGFMDNAVDLLEKAGVLSGNIFTESFSSIQKVDSGKMSVSRLTYFLSAGMIAMGIFGIASYDFLKKELKSLDSEGGSESSSEVTFPTTTTTTNSSSVNNNSNNNYKPPKSRPS